MPSIEVFKGPVLVDTVKVEGHFLIQKIGYEICWEPNGIDKECKVGVLEIWILPSLGGPYVIKYVPPTWTLVIDGIVYPNDPYFDVVLANRIVELQYLEYRFVSQGQDGTPKLYPG